MKRNFSLDLSMLALSALTALIIPSSVAMGGSSCEANSSVAQYVTSSIKADTLSAVSGTELPLRISIKNDGDEALNDGSVIIVVARESKTNDFSKDNQFIVTRSVVKTGVSLAAHSSSKFSFAWNIPTSLPSGVYRAESIFSQNGKVFDDASVDAKSPFGNSAKVFVSGEAKGAVFFVASLVGEKNPNIVLMNGTDKDVTLPVTIKAYSGSLSGTLLASETKQISAKAGSSVSIPYVTSSLTEPFSITAETTYKGVPAFYMYSSEDSARECSDSNIPLYSWAMLIGGLGVIMLVLAHLKEKRA